MGFFSSNTKPQSNPEPPQKPEDKSIFHGNSQVSRYDIMKQFKDHFKKNASKYGLNQSQISQVEKLFPGHMEGTIQLWELDEAIRIQEGELRKLAGGKYEEQKVIRGLIQFLRDMKNLH